MNLTRFEIDCNDIVFPAVIISTEASRGTIMLLHGYGGNKEEMLGLGWRLAESGFNAISIDMRGHGQNKAPMDDSLLDDADALTDYFRSEKPFIVVGHSLGGRIALQSKAKYRVGISPAIGLDFSDEMKHLIHFMRDYRVSEDSCNIFDVIEKLPNIESSIEQHDFVVYGTRDVPEIVDRCKNIQSANGNVVAIDEAQHGDIFLYEKTYQAIKNFLDANIKKI
jgi:alpha-beta hydrolase superfamily lysophospholipase